MFAMPMALMKLYFIGHIPKSTEGDDVFTVQLFYDDLQFRW